MSTDAADYLATFDALPVAARQEVAAEILRRTGEWQSPPLQDEELSKAADELFTALDAREAADGS